MSRELVRFKDSESRGVKREFTDVILRRNSVETINLIIGVKGVVPVPAAPDAAEENII